MVLAGLTNTHRHQMLFIDAPHTDTAPKRATETEFAFLDKMRMAGCRVAHTSLSYSFQ